MSKTILDSLENIGFREEMSFWTKCPHGACLPEALMHPEVQDIYFSCQRDAELQLLHRDGQYTDENIPLGLRCKSVRLRLVL